jgi:hypothetical protein
MREILYIRREVSSVYEFDANGNQNKKYTPQNELFSYFKNQIDYNATNRFIKNRFNDIESPDRIQRPFS